MNEFIAISALGSDRPGIVAQVTRFITQRGGNIEDSRMAILGGEFGLLILVSGPPEKTNAIVAAKSALEAETGLSFNFRPTKSPEEHRRAIVLPCNLHAEALDNEGIVMAIAGSLHELGVNIVSLETTAYHAPITGTPLFRLEALLDVPRGLTVTQLRKAMEAVAERENIDIEVRSPIGRSEYPRERA